MFAHIYQMLLSLVVGVASARYLGPSNYGIINYAASYISFFTIACALGLEGVAVKEMIGNRGSEGVILGSSIAMRLVAGALSMAAVYIIVAAVNPGDRVLLIVAFLQSTVLIFNAFHIIDIWYQSLLRSKVSSVIKCAAYTAMSAYKVWLLVTGKSVEWFAFATSLDALIIALLFLAAYKRDGRHRLRVDMDTGRRLLGLSYHLIISGIMAVAYNQMDRLMIGKMIGQTHVGYYSAASVICHMWLFVPQALSNSARPLIMEMKGKNEALYIRRIKQVTGATLWMGIAFAAVMTVFSRFIINVLYGEDYAEARGPLMLMVWSTVFSALSYTRSTWMICEGRQRYVKQILFIGLAVNLVLNSIGIPLIGMNGAAAATLATELICCLAAPLLFKDTREYVGYLLDSFNLVKLLRGAK